MSAIGWIGGAGMKLDVYENLLRINAGFDQAIRGFAALRKHGAFHRGALARFAALSKETRAAATSYILSESRLQRRTKPAAASASGRRKSEPMSKEPDASNHFRRRRDWKTAR